MASAEQKREEGVGRPDEASARAVPPIEEGWQHRETKAGVGREARRLFGVNNNGKQAVPLRGIQL
ncbi:hypothetical protein HPP92_007699 [Vanilla planifolia]|uniref:Uncharacterized protein n=1 Tax=Vanilla planifolia TaxID=51239 RepID=A0A835V8Y9_VANPL|nr:hypothetical protein HPP92_007699 [Vanilla planifolia]